MMTLFTKALAVSTAVSVTATSTAANMLLTGVISAAVFNARLTHTWLAGLLCVTLGTVLITAASQNAADTEAPKKCGKQE
jgi:putative Mn2+ efflux pump MntP